MEKKIDLKNLRSKIKENLIGSNKEKAIQLYSDGSLDKKESLKMKLQKSNSQKSAKCVNKNSINNSFITERNLKSKINFDKVNMKELDFCSNEKDRNSYNNSKGFNSDSNLFNRKNTLSSNKVKDFKETGKYSSNNSNAEIGKFNSNGSNNIDINKFNSSNSNKEEQAKKILSNSFSQNKVIMHTENNVNAYENEDNNYENNFRNNIGNDNSILLTEVKNTNFDTNINNNKNSNTNIKKNNSNNNNISNNPNISIFNNFIFSFAGKEKQKASSIEIKNRGQENINLNINNMNINLNTNTTNTNLNNNNKNFISLSKTPEIKHKTLRENKQEITNKLSDNYFSSDKEPIKTEGNTNTENKINLTIKKSKSDSRKNYQTEGEIFDEKEKLIFKEKEQNIGRYSYNFPKHYFSIGYILIVIACKSIKLKIFEYLENFTLANLEEIKKLKIKKCCLFHFLISLEEGLNIKKDFSIENFFRSYSDDFRNFVCNLTTISMSNRPQTKKKCLQGNPIYNLNSRRLMEHPWLKLDSDKFYNKKRLNLSNIKISLPEIIKIVRESFKTSLIDFNEKKYADVLNKLEIIVNNHKHELREENVKEILSAKKNIIKKISVDLGVSYHDFFEKILCLVQDVFKE